VSEAPNRDWNYEELTEEEARLRHPDWEMLQVFSIVDRTGERRPAIFVWRREENADVEDRVAVYWLK